MDKIYNPTISLTAAIDKVVSLPATTDTILSNDSQQLTPLMLEIITFQLQERALFVELDTYTTSLN